MDCGIRARKVAPTVPSAVNICTLDNLYEFALGDVTDFDEARVENDNIWRVECNTFGRSLPLDHSNLPISRVSVPIHIDSKFYTI